MTKDDQKNIMKMDTMIEAQNIALGRRGCGVEDVLAFCTSLNTILWFSMFVDHHFLNVLELLAQNVPVIKMIFQRQCF